MRLSAFSKLFRPNIMTGIDIQPGMAYFAQIKHSKPGLRLVKAASCPLEASFFADDKVSQWDNVTEILFGWVRELGLEGAVVSAALPLSQTRLWSVNGVSQPSDEWLQHHLDQELPGLNNALVADYIVQPSSVLVAAAKRDYVEHYTACLKEAGLQPKIMDIDVYAIFRASVFQDAHLPFLWQQRSTFTLIWQDENDVPQQLKWQVVSGAEASIELAKHLKALHITTLWFCGADYYANQFSQLIACTIHRYTLSFTYSGVNLPDYLLALGLAMREVPAW